MNIMICLLLLSEGWEAEPRPHLTVADEGWKVLRVINKTCVYVEGREVESDMVGVVTAHDIVITSSDVRRERRDVMVPTGGMMKGRERAIVQLTAKEVKKIKVGDRILGGAELKRNGTRLLKNENGSSSEPWFYYRDDSKNKKR